MATPIKLVSAPPDPRGRLVSIFVGAVLFPSLALSVVLFYLIPRHAEATKVTLYKRAEKVLYYVEEDLEELARVRALEAGELIGVDRLLEARPHAIEEALQAAGFGSDVFDALHLEVSSPWEPRPVDGFLEGEDLLPEELPVGGQTGEALDSVEFPLEEGDYVGTLRFRFSDGYRREELVRSYFEEEFAQQEQGLVVRVIGRGGEVVYENAPTPNPRSFEVQRRLAAPSLEGLTLLMRNRERSIDDDVRRWKMGTLTLIGFIDLMLGAGLILVYSNVRREMLLSRLKSDFVANVSHELKTPLALIRLFAETLELGRVPSEERKLQYYRVINKESHRLTQLINNILDFSRIEAGRKEYEFAPADLVRIVEEVIESYRFQIEQQGFVLEVQLAEGLPEMNLDKEAMSQALINLLNNAIKYSHEEKYLRVELVREDGTVRLGITDKGIGVAKGEQAKIFDKFYRSEDSLVHDTKGSGLGLALVRHIMEAHGGRVLIDSARGRGSTFSLVLPLDRKEA